jgi:hypothetical protein
LAKEKALHCEFKCNLCGTDIKLPLCCKKESIMIKDGKIMCDLCGSVTSVPVCCGKEIRFVGVN